MKKNVDTHVSAQWKSRIFVSTFTTLGSLMTHSDGCLSVDSDKIICVR